MVGNFHIGLSAWRYYDKRYGERSELQDSLVNCFFFSSLSFFLSACLPAVHPLSLSLSISHTHSLTLTLTRICHGLIAYPDQTETSYVSWTRTI